MDGETDCANTPLLTQDRREVAAPRAPGRVATGRQAALAVRPLTRATSDLTQDLLRRHSRRAHSAKEIRLRRRLQDQRVFRTGLPHPPQRGHDQEDYGAQSPPASGATKPCNYHRTA